MYSQTSKLELQITTNIKIICSFKEILEWKYKNKKFGGNEMFRFLKVWLYFIYILMILGGLGAQNPNNAKISERISQGLVPEESNLQLIDSQLIIYSMKEISAHEMRFELSGSLSGYPLSIWIDTWTYSICRLYHIGHGFSSFHLNYTTQTERFVAKLCTFIYVTTYNFHLKSEQ